MRRGHGARQRMCAGGLVFSNTLGSRWAKVSERAPIQRRLGDFAEQDCRILVHGGVNKLPVIRVTRTTLAIKSGQECTDGVD